MRIHVQFYSYFADLTGCSVVVEELQPGSTIDDLLNQLHRRFPKLAGSKGSTLVAVGVDYAPRSYTLKEGDAVALFPPVQGG